MLVRWLPLLGFGRQEPTTVRAVADKHNSDKSNIQDASRRVTITCETTKVAPIVKGLIHEAKHEARQQEFNTTIH